MEFQGSIGLVQRVLPSYRLPFFDKLATECSDGLTLFAGEPLPIESINTLGQPSVARLVRLRNIHFLDPSKKMYLCYQYGLGQALRNTLPTALIFEANYRYLSSYPAIQWAKRSNIPLVGWGLGAKPLSGGLRQLRNHFLGQFGALVAYSAAGAEEFALTGFPREKIWVAKNAATDAPTALAPIRQLSKKARLLFVGRLQPRKRIDLLIEVFASLKDRYGAELVIVGDGPDRVRLEGLAGTRDSAIRFAGHLEGQALEQEFLQADLFVLPGTGGLAVQQAMSFALPLIVAEGDGTQDDLVTPRNGWLVKPADRDDLASKIHYALQDRAKLEKMGQESYRIVQDEVNIAIMAKTFIKAIGQAKG